MKKTLDIFVDCFELVNNKLIETDKAEVDKFVEQVSLMVPCLSFRPDSIQEFNDKIFKSVTLTHFMFDLSFKFFSLAGDDDSFVDKLINKLLVGLQIDGPLFKYSIIPKEIAASCPMNLFYPGNNFISKIVNDGANSDSLYGFLQSNKHFLLLYLMHLTNQ